MPLAGKAALSGSLTARRAAVALLLVLAIVGVVLFVPAASGAAQVPPAGTAEQIDVSGFVCPVLMRLLTVFGPLIANFIQSLFGLFGCASP